MTSKTERDQHVNPFQRLDDLVKTLRSGQGCPWDQKQTATSLKKYLLEEAAELAEAIDLGDHEHICEETGDLYFILTLLAAIFEEQGHFSNHEALNAVCDKMVRRHPHVFAADKDGREELSEEQLKSRWEQRKRGKPAGDEPASQSRFSLFFL